jgi:hypothetical protein
MYINGAATKNIVYDVSGAYGVLKASLSSYLGVKLAMLYSCTGCRIYIRKNTEICRSFI